MTTPAPDLPTRPPRGPVTLARVVTLVMLALVAGSLLCAVLGGLLRAGLGWPWLQDPHLIGPAAAAHAQLMLPGWLGMVISIERAVAVRRRWAWAAPLGAGLGSAALLAGWPLPAALLGVGAAAVAVAVQVVVLRRQRAGHTWLLLAATLAWLAGSSLVLIGLLVVRLVDPRAAVPGLDVAAALPWWFLLPVLTIAAERLEMTRLTRRHDLAQPVLLAIVAVLAMGAAAAAIEPAGPLGGVLYGLGLIALALWLFTFDIARRTLFAHGLARYMAVSLLAGYAWLALAGLGWMGLALGCPGRDLALHALGLGFIVSMVMGHAPVILPAVARVKLQVGWWF
ncbi:hypothetical protein ACWA7J_12155 [Leptothrix sp. BB-4]